MMRETIREMFRAKGEDRALAFKLALIHDECLYDLINNNTNKRIGVAAANTGRIYLSQNYTLQFSRYKYGEDLTLSVYKMGDTRIKSSKMYLKAIYRVNIGSKPTLISFINSEGKEKTKDFKKYLLNLMDDDGRDT